MNVIKSWLWSVVALLAAVLFVTSIGVNDRLTKVLALVVLAIAVIDIARDVMTDVDRVRRSDSESTQA